MSLPESPRWLILKGREEEALTVLSALNDMPPTSPYVKNEFTAIKDTVLEMEKGSFRDLFTMGEDRHFHRVVLAYVNQVFQQISGINLITYYIPNVLQKEVGLTPVLAKLIAACNGTEYFMASWIAVFTIEKFGRRQLMLFGAAGQSMCMVVLAVTDKIGGTKAGIGQTIFLFLFNTFFAVGWLGMTWLYPAGKDENPFGSGGFADIGSRRNRTPENSSSGERSVHICQLAVQLHGKLPEARKEIPLLHLN